ncbi:MAG TPA: 4Fe-4S double cluster binding domain-containing protein, partial [bacterium]|nr:4Fe-4S double cluster binding domain-containing protein [bacterium]
PLETSVPVETDCGDCYSCIEACPAGAIKKNRQEFDPRSCFSKLDEFRKKYQISHHICGICVKACPGKEDR